MPPRGSDDYGDLIERREPNALPMALLAIAGVAMLGAIVLHAVELQGYRYGEESLEDSAAKYRSDAFKLVERNLTTAFDTVSGARQSAQQILGEVKASGFKPVEAGVGAGTDSPSAAPAPSPEVTPSAEPSTEPPAEPSDTTPTE
ncbi:MAG: hypothetical protein JXP34_22670 [Planctomycetes bacterium]|nr:hypothetical protein [Planctomycetota bacterium]